MPELPEVESLRRTLAPHLVGLRVRTARLLRPEILRLDGGRRRSRRSALLAGARLIELRRHGKQLAIIGDDGRVLCIHLGMTGQLRFLAGDEQLHPATHIHAEWTMTAEPGGLPPGRLIFRDPRRFGGLWAGALPGTLEAKWAALGPDGLESSMEDLTEALARGCRGSRRALKAILLDQAVIAGVGNIYADEACFSAGIDPARPGTAINRDETIRLAEAIRATLQAALTRGGSTLRDYVDANGRSGAATLLHRVYGRGGQPCLVCGTPLPTRLLAQRTTVSCPRCQPAR